MITDWHSKRVTVMGLGGFGGGIGVTRWLARQGAQVTLTDRAPADKLQDALAQLADLPLTLRLGGHVEHDFRGVDLVVANPAVPPSSPFLEIARHAGVPVTTEINLFVERCPARTVGVTGSVGKSTITSMIGHVLTHAQNGAAVHVGGNIGRSLLDDLPRIRHDDFVVLELSSFQLHWTPQVRWSPHVAVISNVTPNHLDWHGTFAAYLADKLNIVRFQRPEHDAIVVENVPALCHNFGLLFGDVAGLWRYGTDAADLVAVQQSTPAVDCDDRHLRWPTVALAVPGAHNRRNAAAALTVAAVLGLDPERAAAALATFAGLPHRLCRVAVIDDVTYYDDSKSTTPEAVITALAALDQPVHIILGGYDKGSDLTPAVEAVAARARFAACLGQTGPRLVEALRARGVAAELFDSLAAATAACRAHAQPGDVVLLSPGCASWDMFTDYRARGLAFQQLVTNSPPA